jgi:tRNA (cytidine/uridine-2'-O-)-methyltransferase
MPVELALYQPEIAQNTGTLLRLGACFGVPVHIIRPTGFPLSPRTLKRGALDYLEHAEMIEHDSFAHFTTWASAAGRRLILLTTKASQSAYDTAYAGNDLLLLGRESVGVPPDVAASVGLKVRIPMQPGLRSINVAVAGALILGEALRQTHRFETLQ